MAPFGMIGVGTIYRWLRDGRLIAEDELAVAYDPITTAIRNLQMSRAIPMESMFW
jgi:hypothetical protein